MAFDLPPSQGVRVLARRTWLEFGGLEKYAADVPVRLVLSGLRVCRGPLDSVLEPIQESGASQDEPPPPHDGGAPQEEEEEEEASASEDGWAEDSGSSSSIYTSASGQAAACYHPAVQYSPLCCNTIQRAADIWYELTNKDVIVDRGSSAEQVGRRQCAQKVDEYMCIPFGYESGRLQLSAACEAMDNADNMAKCCEGRHPEIVVAKEMLMNKKTEKQMLDWMDQICRYQLKQCPTVYGGNINDNAGELTAMDTEVLDGYGTEDKTAVNSLNQVMNAWQCTRASEGCMISKHAIDKAGGKAFVLEGRASVLGLAVGPEALQEAVQLSKASASGAGSVPLAGPQGKRNSGRAISKRPVVDKAAAGQPDAPSPRPTSAPRGTPAGDGAPRLRDSPEAPPAARPRRNLRPEQEAGREDSKQPADLGAHCFGHGAFAEAMCRIAFAYLHFSGTAQQQSMGSLGRATWLIAYLRSSLQYFGRLGPERLLQRPRGCPLRSLLAAMPPEECGGCPREALAVDLPPATVRHGVGPDDAVVRATTRSLRRSSTSKTVDRSGGQRRPSALLSQVASETGAPPGGAPHAPPGVGVLDAVPPGLLSESGDDSDSSSSATSSCGQSGVDVEATFSMTISSAPRKRSMKVRAADTGGSLLLGAGRVDTHGKVRRPSRQLSIVALDSLSPWPPVGSAWIEDGVWQAVRGGPEHHSVGASHMSRLLGGGRLQVPAAPVQAAPAGLASRHTCLQSGPASRRASADIPGDRSVASDGQEGWTSGSAGSEDGRHLGGFQAGRP
ncbi:unnamed protein product [Prorocentrum cordatum]|uniref:Poly(ADP-ribose) glycohydrolase n=1 Tax=Prorocentrum cordatum TaxID=2364126 RepID=A0ABN9U6W6_9DINO|nr:unnamed protein product [Polarella glacialis]